MQKISGETITKDISRTINYQKGKSDTERKKSKEKLNIINYAERRTHNLEKREGKEKRQKRIATMPRCFTVRKYSAQHNSTQPNGRKMAGSSSDASEYDGKKPHRKVAVIQVGKRFICRSPSVRL